MNEGRNEGMKEGMCGILGHLSAQARMAISTRSLRVIVTCTSMFEFWSLFLTLSRLLQRHHTVPMLAEDRANVKHARPALSQRLLALFTD